MTRAEVEAALRGYLRALGGIIPVLINRRLQDLAKRKRPEQPRREGEDAAVAQLVQSEALRLTSADVIEGSMVHVY